MSKSPLQVSLSIQDKVSGSVTAYFSTLLDHVRAEHFKTLDRVVREFRHEAALIGAGWTVVHDGGLIFIRWPLEEPTRQGSISISLGVADWFGARTYLRVLRENGVLP